MKSRFRRDGNGFLASILLTGTLASNHCLAARPGRRAEETTEAGKQKRSFDAHDTGIRFHFNDTDMDFHFGTLVLSAAREPWRRDGPRPSTRPRIKDGDARELAGRVVCPRDRAEARAARPLPAATG